MIRFFELIIYMFGFAVLAIIAGVLFIIVYKIKEIREVHLKLCFKRDRVSIWTSDSVYVKGEEYATKPENIFKTYEDAEKALDIKYLFSDKEKLTTAKI